MQWHEFVFSTKPRVRLLRHAVFWTAWWLYYVVCYHLFAQPSTQRFSPYYVQVGSHLVLKTFLLLLISSVACYAVNYFILPQILKGKRLKPTAAVLALCGLLYGLGYFMYWTVFPFVDTLFGTGKPVRMFTRFWPAIYLGLLDPLKIVAAAAIIKYIKYWWQKEQESKRLEQEKIDAELQLLKAQIQPRFLFTALNNLYTFSLASSPRAPEMLLKLSDLLSYMLYECNGSLVPLEKELAIMKDYVALEKIRLGDALETELNIRGDANGLMIAPFLLLPFIEDSFQQSSKLTEQAWMNMDISIEKGTLCLKLANGILSNNDGAPLLPEDGLTNVRKRLSLIYPHQHELKMTQGPEMSLVLLKINLTENAAVEKTTTKENSITQPVNLQPNLYVAH